jgi:hypothetical protein
VFSLGITVGYWVGLVAACPLNYSVAKFIIDCANSKHDLMLARKGIFLSPIIKDVMKGMLKINPKQRLTMV